MAFDDPRQSLFDALERACEVGSLPGAVALIWRDGATIYHEAHGKLATHTASGVALGQPVARDTVYDLASLTKVLATTTLVAMEVEAGRIRLDDEVPAPWNAACPGATLIDLLEHRAGLVAHREYFVGKSAGTREALFDELIATPAAAPPKERTCYSDLGFMILGAWLERVCDLPLDDLFRRRITHPLRLDVGRSSALAYRRISQEGWLTSELETRIAPTEVYERALHEVAPSHFPLREHAPLAHGSVHDDNAYVLDGVAGHAGLFGHAEGVLEIAQSWLGGGLPGLSANTRDLFWCPREDRIRRLGWDGQSPDGSGSTAGALGPESVGHLGFTGCSLWIDPAARAIYILLSNRVHPTRGDVRIKQLRREFHELASRLR